MIVNEDFLKRLRSTFDLNIYEVKIWTALLSKGIAAAGELSDISDVPRSRCYDVLETLEKRGFVIMKIGKPIKYIAVKPDEVIKRVKKSFQEVADTQIKTLEKVENNEFYNELNLLFKNGISHIDTNTIAGSIKGRRNIYDQISSMIENAEKEVVIITTLNELAKKYENFGALFKKLNNKGISIKVAVSSTESSKDQKIPRELSQYCEIKNINDICGRFTIVDGKQVIFMLNSDDKVHESYDSGIWVNSPFFASAVSRLFESAWEKSAKV